MATAGDPGLGTIQGSGQHSSFVDPDLWVFLQVVIVPDAFVQSAEGIVFLCQSTVHCDVDAGVRGDHAPQVAGLLDCLQLCLFAGGAWRVVLFLGCGLMENLNIYGKDVL